MTPMAVILVAVTHDLSIRQTVLWQQPASRFSVLTIKVYMTERNPEKEEVKEAGRDIWRRREEGRID